MSRWIQNICLLVILLAGSNSAQAQNARLFLFGANNVHLEANPSGLNAGTATDEDDSTMLLWWGTPNKSKVTVSTFCPGQRFDLFAEATGTKNGKATGRISLSDGMRPTDLIVNIKSRKPGRGRIRYIAQATIEQGWTEPGLSDVHLVSFTITDQ